MVGVNDRLAALVLSVGVLLGTGCGNGEDTSADPCDIPDTALTEAGLKPESARPGTDGVDFEDWTGCTWKATDEEWFTFWLYYGSPGLEEFGTDPRYQHYRPIGPADIDSRKATEFTVNLDPERQRFCHIGIELSDGMAFLWSSLSVRREPGEAKGDGLCAANQRVAQQLSKYLPE